MAPDSRSWPEVVYHVNDSARALLNDAKDEKGEPYQPQVAGLKDKGVEFRVCRNTLTGRKLDDKAVIMDASVVASGVAEIGRLQSKEGYVYLKP